MWTDEMAFIGAGNIAEIVMDRLVNLGSLTPAQLFACDISATRRAYLRERFRGLRTSEDPQEAARFSRCVVIATPPGAVLNVVHEIRPMLSANHILVSLATSVSIAQIEKAAGDVHVVRVLINSASLVGEGMNMVAFGHYVSPDYHKRTINLLGLFGPYFEVSDEQMDFWCAICSAGPTYVLPVIEALAKAAMSRGISHDQALMGASQVVLGAARLVQQTGRDPKDLERLSASLCTLHEEEVQRLYTDAYEEALRKLRRAAVAVTV